MSSIASVVIVEMDGENDGGCWDVVSASSEWLMVVEEVGVSHL